jgi:protein-tyrosine phosphatase
MSVVGMSKILENLYLGCLEDALHAPPDFVIVCVLEYQPPNEPPGAYRFPFLEGGVANVKVLDDFADLVDKLLAEGRKVLVHCGMGVERSPLAVVWYLHRKKGMSIAEAYKYVMARRSVVADRTVWLPKFVLNGGEQHTL